MKTRNGRLCERFDKLRACKLRYIGVDFVVVAVHNRQRGCSTRTHCNPERRAV